jgi:hypothetical protein
MFSAGFAGAIDLIGVNVIAQIIFYSAKTLRLWRDLLRSGLDRGKWRKVNLPIKGCWRNCRVRRWIAGCFRQLDWRPSQPTEVSMWERSPPGVSFRRFRLTCSGGAVAFHDSSRACSFLSSSEWDISDHIGTSS